MKMERFDEEGTTYYASATHPEVAAYMNALRAESGEAMTNTAAAGSIVQPELAPLWGVMMLSGTGMTIFYGDDDQAAAAVASALAGKAGSGTTKYYLRQSRTPMLEANQKRTANTAGSILGVFYGVEN